MSNTIIKADASLVDELCSITSVSRIVANNLLEACDNNLEMAINMQMEGVMDSNETCAPPSDDEVRAPIPQRQEVLVEGPDQLAYSFRGRNRVSRSVFDKFRDFEAEAKRQEEELMEGTSCASTAEAQTFRRRRKMKTLEDLFRPPLDLMFRGSFQSAREAGIGLKKWLMVNVQNSSEFPCQVLNRDVWSNSAVKAIVQEHFVFWQIYHDSEEGQRYMNFYPVSEWPYLAVIDPRTGERLVAWQRLDALSFCELVTEFLSAHPPLDESFHAAAAKDTPTPTAPRKKVKWSGERNILEADEDAQLEAAIQASLQSSSSSSSTSKSEATKSSASSSSSSSRTNGRGEDEDDDSDGLETFESDSESSDLKVAAPPSLPPPSLPPPSLPLPLTPEADVKMVNGVDEEAAPAAGLRPPPPSVGSLTNGNSALEEEEEEEENGSDEESEEEEMAGQEEGEKWKQYLGKESEPESRLMLRLPDGSRDTLKIPSTSKLMAVVLYVGTKGFSNESYELVTTFPKRQLSTFDFSLSLKSVGLFPQETIFVQKR